MLPSAESDHEFARAQLSVVLDLCLPGVTTSSYTSLITALDGRTHGRKKEMLTKTMPK
jgi:hypothetical protein